MLARVTEIFDCPLHRGVNIRASVFRTGTLSCGLVVFETARETGTGDGIEIRFFRQYSAVWFTHWLLISLSLDSRDWSAIASLNFNIFDYWWLR